MTTTAVIPIKQLENAKRHAETLTRLGFEIDAFGDRSVVVRAAPEVLAAGETVNALRDLLDELSSFGKNYAFSAACEKHLYTIACHASVRANDRLDRQEVEHLLSEMDQIDFAGSCPHGRPVYARLDQSQIAKLFHRK